MCCVNVFTRAFATVLNGASFNVWCKDQPLKEACLNLFNLSGVKEASMEDNLQLLNGSPQWEVEFIHGTILRQITLPPFMLGCTC